MGVEVIAPDGRGWVVSRSIRWPRYRDTGLDFIDVGPVDLGDGLLAGIVLFVVIGLLIVVLAPVILLIVEVVFAVAASLFLRRAWVVTARSADPPEVREWRVRGLFRSRAAVREVADELRRGVPAEPEHALT